MLAYQKSDFEKKAQSQAIHKWLRDGLLSESDGKALMAAFQPPFYSPSIFARMGLFLFGSLGASAVLGIFLLMLSPMLFSNGNNEKAYGALLILFGVGLLVFLEVLIQRPKPFFRAGLEEAALYGAMGSSVTGFFLLFDGFQHPHFGIILCIALFYSCAALRYADSLLAATAFGLLFFALFDLSTHWGSLARPGLPLMVIVVSACMAQVTGRLLSKESLFYWKHVWKVLRFIALITCYLGGNYFVVRELSQLLFNLSLGLGEDIPMAFGFKSFTFTLPILYLAWGMYKHDRLVLRAGLVTVAMAVFTYKYYHHFLPVEIALVLGGACLLVLGGFTLKLLRVSRYGITTKAENDFSSDNLINAESLISLATLPGKEAPAHGPESDGFQGGGGKFGGGGASGGF